jgi:hypothetical protein
VLAAVVLGALVGALCVGAAAWSIYQRYGPVQRNVYEQISGSTSTQTQTVGQLAQVNAASVVTIATQPVTATEDDCDSECRDTLAPLGVKRKNGP